MLGGLCLRNPLHPFLSGRDGAFLKATSVGPWLLNKAPCNDKARLDNLGKVLACFKGAGLLQEVRGRVGGGMGPHVGRLGHKGERGRECEAG